MPELRQRIREGEIVEYEACRTSHTEARPDGTYCYCVLDSGMPFSEYLPRARRAQAAAKAQGSLEDGEDPLSLFFVSSVHWISYDAIVQPTPSRRTPTPASPGANTGGRGSGSFCRSLFSATMPWWTACIWVGSISTWRLN